MGDNTQVLFQHRFTPELRRRLDGFIARENERIAPAELSMRAVVNEAVEEWLNKRQRRARAEQGGDDDRAA